ncbi:MAG: MBL fold metallo-hydrolase [bacterium]|jgi:glyoxylase-like metal-dependent hydrolase (beta-lactamase superfamily II)
MIVFESANMKLHAISDGSFALDGGLMYGVVPKSFWQKWHDVDAENRIRLGVWCLVAETREGLVVVDTGCGDKLSEKLRGIYDLQRPEGDLIEGMKAEGLSPDDVVAVIQSHLHFDHCGGVTKKSDSGWALQFPNATVYSTSTEYAEATLINERTKGSYYKHTLEGWEPGERLKLLDGETEILPGVRAIPSPGHTLGHQLVLFDDAGMRLVYWGDLIPMSTFTHIPVIASIDNYPMVTLERKKEFLKRAAEEKWHQFFCHNFGSPYSEPPAAG